MQIGPRVVPWFYAQGLAGIARPALSRIFVSYVLLSVIVMQQGTRPAMHGHDVLPVPDTVRLATTRQTHAHDVVIEC